MATKLMDNAKKNKADEFYTQLVDIELEMKYYKEYFQGKTVFCNCDDPFESNFFKYFAMNFNHLGLKKLICTCYAKSAVAWVQLSLFEHGDVVVKTEGGRKPYKIEITEVADYNGDGAIDLSDVEYLLKNDKNTLTILNGDGDFRSEECIELLKEADVVVTNPPFSLFREYVAQLVEYDKDFIIIGNQNAITYKEIFPLIKNDKLWLGNSIHSGDREFRVPVDYDVVVKNNRIDENGFRYVRVTGVRWFTNIDYKERHEDLILWKKYTPDEFPEYENYHGINVNKTSDIPFDYDGDMGVPITFLDKYNPNQFEIVALGIVGSIDFSSERKMEILDKDGMSTGKFTVNAKGTLYRKYNSQIDTKPPAFKDCETGVLYQSIYARVIIRRKANENRTA